VKGGDGVPPNENKLIEKDYLKRALSYLPIRLSYAVAEAIEKYGEPDELRLVKNAEAALVINGQLCFTEAVCRVSEMTSFIRAVCGSSLYSHSESIREGYIITGDGIRVGVAGRAVTESGRIVGVTEFDSAVIRIPSRRPGFADELFNIMKRYCFRKNTLVFSPPSGGKTTLLRELVHLLAKEKHRVAVVDTRFEIAEGLEGDHIYTLSGYPRAKGMEIAVRTLSPEVVVCDEINTAEDLDAVSTAVGSGAAVVATCHAETFSSAKRRVIKLSRGGEYFDIFYGVDKSGAGAFHLSDKGDAA